MEPLVLTVDANYDSPWAMSAFVALEEKQLPFTLKTVVLSKQETFALGYPGRTRRVPTLEHGNFTLAESSAIAEYLAETFPYPAHPRLFPEDLKERALCREIQGWLRSGLQTRREERPTSTIWFARATKPLSEKAQEVAKRFLDSVSPLIKPGATSLFGSFCIADADLAVMLQRLNLNGEPLPAHLKVYCESVWHRASLSKWHALSRGAMPL